MFSVSSRSLDKHRSITADPLVHFAQSGSRGRLRAATSTSRPPPLGLHSRLRKGWWGGGVPLASVVVPFQHSLSSTNNWLFFLQSAICACFRSIKCLLVSFLLIRVCCSVFFSCPRGGGGTTPNGFLPAAFFLKFAQVSVRNASWIS